MRWVLAGIIAWVLIVFLFALWWRSIHRYRPPSPSDPLYLPEGRTERYRREELR